MARLGFSPPRRQSIGSVEVAPPQVRRHRGPSPPRQPARSSDGNASAGILQSVWRLSCCRRRAAFSSEAWMRQQQLSPSSHGSFSRVDRSETATMSQRHSAGTTPLARNSAAGGIAGDFRGRAIPNDIEMESNVFSFSSGSSARISEGVYDPWRKKHFDVAFQEFLLGGCEELGGFARARNVTPPPSDLVGRAFLPQVLLPSMPARQEELLREEEPACGLDEEWEALPMFRNEVREGAPPKESLGQPARQEELLRQEEPRCGLDEEWEALPTFRNEVREGAPLKEPLGQRLQQRIRSPPSSPHFGAAESPWSACDDQAMPSPDPLAFTSAELVMARTSRSPGAVRGGHVLRDSPAESPSSVCSDTFEASYPSSNIGKLSLGRSAANQFGRSLRRVKRPIAGDRLAPGRGRTPVRPELRSNAGARGGTNEHAPAWRREAVSPRGAEAAAPLSPVRPRRSEDFRVEGSPLQSSSTAAAAPAAFASIPLAPLPTQARSRVASSPPMVALPRDECPSSANVAPSSNGVVSGQNIVANELQPPPKPTAQGAASRPKTCMAPPPPPKAKAKSKAVAKAGRSASEAPGGAWAGSRRMSWRTLPGTVENSIFDLGGSAADFNLEEYHELFMSGHDMVGKQRSNSVSVASETGVCVLTQHQAMNASIVLRKAGDLQPLCEVLAALDCVGEEEGMRLQELLDLIDDGQLARLRATATSNKAAKPLRAIERQLMPLAHLERVRPRLRLVRLGGSLHAQRSHICDTAGTIATVCSLARESHALRDLVHTAMSLRDYVQNGPDALAEPAGRPRVMDIGSLLSGMKEFKAVQPGAKHLSLLHFFVRSLLRMRPDFETRLAEQLRGLREAARISWAALREGLSQLRNDVGFAASEARDHQLVYGEGGSERLTALAADAGEAAVEAAAAIEAAAGALAELARYFGVRDANATAKLGDPKEPPGLPILQQLSELLLGFSRACEEVRDNPDDWIAGDSEETARGMAAYATSSRRLGSASPCRAAEFANAPSSPVRAKAIC